MMQLLDATAFSLSLYHTSSDIWFRGQESSSLMHRHRRLLTQEEYSVWLIITKLEQVVTLWNAILFQLD